VGNGRRDAAKETESEEAKGYDFNGRSARHENPFGEVAEFDGLRSSSARPHESVNRIRGHCGRVRLLTGKDVVCQT